MLIIHALANSWAELPDLKEQSYRWSWFSQAFHNTLDSSIAHSKFRFRANNEALAGAFFAWAKTVEAYEDYERLDPLDFCHFKAALLLQKLVAANPPVTDVLVDKEAPSLVKMQPVSQIAVSVMPFVITLLQAWRLHSGSSPLVINPELMQGALWASFMENMIEDSYSAIGFMDQIFGLEPVWQSPTRIESRPAFKKAMARHVNFQDVAGHSRD